jgi:hypothetical protein
MVIYVLLKLAYQSHRTCLSCIHVTRAGRQKKRAPIKNHQQRSSSPVNPFWSHQAHNQNVWTRDMKMSNCQKHRQNSDSRREPASQIVRHSDVHVPVQMPCCTNRAGNTMHRSVTLALTNNTRQTRQNHCVNKTVPLLKTIVHSVPRCSHFYRQFPATCLLLRSNPPQHHSQTYNPQDGP